MTRLPGSPRAHRVLRRVAQTLVVAAALYFLWSFARRHEADLGRVPWRLAYGPLVLASFVWTLSFGGLVLLWSRSLRWWGTAMRGLTALRVFFLANLARYVPGAVWQFAGLAAMSAAQGVPPVAATAAVLWQQAALLGTGAVLAIALAPVMLEPLFRRWHLAVPSLGVRLTIAIALVAFVVLALPRVLPPLRSAIERRVRDVRAVPHVTPWQFASYLALTTVGWLGYGASFAIFAHAVLGADAPPALQAGAIYIAAYVLGIVVIFVPGGLGVREGALTAGLTPLIGVDRALFLSIASRLWLVALEILGALAVVGAGRPVAASPAPEQRER